MRLVAVEHTIITAVWHMLSSNIEYRDLGGDHHIRRDPKHARRRAIRALNQLGYTVTLNPSKKRRKPGLRADFRWSR